MAATKWSSVKKKRRRKVSQGMTGKEAWQIVNADGSVLVENGYGEGAILAMAQTLIQKEEDPTEYGVRLKPLFGQTVPFYKVRLHEDGSVSTSPEALR